MNLDSEFIANNLKSGSCIIMLDGLDEVVDLRMRKLVARMIDEFVAQYGEKNIVIVTSRIIGYSEARLSLGFDEYTISPFDNNQISEYIDKWVKVAECFEKGHDFDINNSLAQSASLKHLIFENENMNELARIPLLLEIFCILYRQGIPIPARKIELYESVCRALVQTWELNKGLDLSMDFTDIFDILQSVAYWFYREDRISVTGYEIRDYLRQQINKLGISARDSKIQSEQFLRESSERSGIIVEHGLNEYGFSHIALRDYLAAREIAGFDHPMENFMNQLYAPKNVEIISLVAAVFSTQGRRNKSSALVNAILNSSTEYDKITHLNLIVVLKCLLDGATIDGETKNRVLTELKEILSDPDQYINNALVRYTGLLLSTPLKDDVESLLSNVIDSNPDVICSILSRYHFGLANFQGILSKIYLKGTREHSKKIVESLCSLISKKAADKDKFAMSLLRDLLRDADLDFFDIGRILTPLITLAESDSEARDILKQIKSSGKTNVVKALDRYSCYLDSSSYADLYLDTKMATEVQIQEPTGRLTSREKVSILKKSLQNGEILLFYQFGTIAADLEAEDIAEIVELAFSSAAKGNEFSFRIIDALHESLKRGLISESKMRDAMKNIKASDDQQVKLITLIHSRLNKDTDYSDILTQIIIDKDQYEVFRRTALDEYSATIKDTNSLEFVYGLLDDPALFNNAANTLLERRYRLDDVGRRTIEEIINGGKRELVGLLASIQTSK